jgi:hypothetical protein
MWCWADGEQEVIREYFPQSGGRVAVRPDKSEGADSIRPFAFFPQILQRYARGLDDEGGEVYSCRGSTVLPARSPQWENRWILMCSVEPLAA